ncbi:MAG TPA: protoporphyrinogen oxidase HemJ [Leptospiraceae bacterium]|nr:protoporphyrinogen oxidase HemJ [Leptospiraceae bacterium]HMW05137.1 protoporphyrinogen oxidase HemJ [Leptospiraceae bacterium]HMX32602.1 protoporphyrinogen oxidase HemJ [Leptospiraceae bacterium]HMY32476.1 protoporphyrinogen oxidase HemJ [Leptospiraceae bacterium]HMZ66616.1 protoporphyrinogen oxidase HemJ [Leptospiraceae bacterium]
MYLWFKALHIISLIAWFAGIFYIWRLFVYHTETNSEDVKATLAIMERKLYTIIMRPAMFATLFFGFGLFYLQWNAFSNSIWIWLKIFLVILVVGQHHMANFYRKKLLEGVVYRSKKFRILNEIPTLLMILIVILVVFKPF